MQKRDYIPTMFGELASFLTNLLNLVSAAQSRLGISAAALAALQTAINEFLAANAIADHPSATNVDRQNRKDAAEVAKAVTRDFVNLNLRFNHAVTNGDRQDMGLTIPDHNPTPVPKPTTIPEAKVRLTGQAVIEIHFRDEGADNKSKPAGVHGAEIAWAILDTPPVNWDELIHSSFATHTPLELTFLGEQRGKTLYFALRWESTRGEKGKWSPIQNAIIP